MKYNFIAVLIIVVSFVGIVGVSLAGQKEDPAAEAALNQGDKNSFQPLGNPLLGPIAGDDISEKGMALTVFYGKVINRFIGIVGGLVMLVIAWNGVIWLTSNGQEEKVKKAKMAIVYAVLGLIVIFAAYAIINFLLQVTIEATGSAAPPSGN